MTEGFSIRSTECPFCCDLGMTSYEKPMTGLDGRTITVRVPVRCHCKAGDNYRHQQIVIKPDSAA